MLTIEVDKGEDRTEYLTIDGHRFEPDWIGHDKSDGRLGVGISDAKATKKLTAYTFSQLGGKFCSLDVLLDIDLPSAHFMSIRFGLSIGDSSTSVKFRYFIAAENYAQPWSIADFATKLEEQATARSSDGLWFFQEDEDSLSNGIGIACVANDLNVTVDQFLSHWLPIVKEVNDQALAELAAGVTSESLLTLFRFPGEVATACEQYLLYFVQFLLDLGIEAQANIKHEAGSVLFSVTPTDGPESLDRIRQALDIYLALPSTGDFLQLSGQFQDVSVLQLKANVLHLQGQLALSVATIQAKDAQIEALQLSNYQYRQLLSRNLLVDQPVEPSPITQDEEGEAILGGLAKVKPLEFQGITLNLPEMLRRLKRKFSKR